MKQREIRVLCVCSTGIAQCTMVQMRLKEACAERKIPVTFEKCQYLQAKTQCENFRADFVFEVTPLNIQYGDKVKVFNGFPCLTGVGVEPLLEQFFAAVDNLYSE